MIDDGKSSAGASSSSSVSVQMAASVNARPATSPTTLSGSNTVLVPTTPENKISLESKLSPSNEYLYTSIKTVGIFVGVAALGVFLLYEKASKECAELESCGSWLTWIMGSKAASNLFWILGGAEFALMSFYFAKESLQRWYDYVQQEDSKFWKAIKFLLVPSVTAVLTMYMYYVMKAFNASTEKMILTIVGDAAAKLFVATNLLQRDLPWLAESMRQHLFSDCRDSVEERIRNAHDRAEQQRFIAESQDRYDRFMENAESMIAGDELKDADPRLVLYQLYKPHQGGYALPLHPWLKLLGVIGFGLGLYMARIIGLTILHAMQKESSNDFEKTYGLSVFFSLGTTYIFPYVLTNGFLHIAQGLQDIINKKPITWLSYRANKKATIATVIAAGLMSSVSYAVFNRLADTNEDGSNKLFFVVLASIAMGFYHWFGIDKLYDIVRGSSVTCGERTFFGGKNETEVLLHKMGKDLEGHKWKTLLGFRKDVAANPDVYKAAQVTLYPNNISEQQSGSRWDRFCHFFGGIHYQSVPSQVSAPDRPANVAP